ncbi:pyocin knob domain-containing protein [Paenibacillus sp. SC116]|uniref:pyocin knob domain-containing protein n=1 Tax=Paenibacillus sp. SC116 TaxID=2968986 RepID=UPI00215B60EF|nr:pyocin knob domain-containing protein [Paenibacillus sp. SC116]MCR8844044.1 pyocin knob domain-containing protein [Paenibacillus sp. SC116]
MQLTGNLKLKKPDNTDIVDIADINGNMDILDSEVIKRANQAETNAKNASLPRTGGEISGALAVTGQVWVGKTAAYGGTSALTLPIGDNDTGLHWTGDGGLEFHSNSSTAMKLAGQSVQFRDNAGNWDTLGNVKQSVADVKKANFLPRNTDLNSIVSEGEYYNPLNDDASTMPNVPIHLSFHLKVSRHAGINQVFTTYATEAHMFRVFTRNFYGGWSPWSEILTSYNRPNIRNIHRSTGGPAGGADGDVWHQYE